MTSPSTEQVEAARAEYDRSEDMCAALVAAAVTPPGPRVELLREAREEFLPHSNDVWALDLVARLANALATPVQVDEAKLAEVIWGEQESRVLDGYVIHTRETAATTARAVAEHLRGGGQ